MLRLLKYIMLFLFGYRILKMLFATSKPAKEVQNAPIQPPINEPKFTTNKNTNFTDAEVIDYEEVK